ncbi:unnamed protein product, partial [Medioppia subpectinata]
SSSGSGAATSVGQQQPQTIDRKRRKKANDVQPADQQPNGPFPYHPMVLPRLSASKQMRGNEGNKKINEYFKHSSPSRYGGTKSPTATHSFYMYPPSPGGPAGLGTLGSPTTGGPLAVSELSSMMAPPVPAQRPPVGNSTKNSQQSCQPSLSSNMYSQPYVPPVSVGLTGGQSPSTTMQSPGLTIGAGVPQVTTPPMCSRAVQTDLTVKSLRD